MAIYHLLLDRIVDEEMAEIKKKLMNKKVNHVVAPPHKANGSRQSFSVNMSDPKVNYEMNDPKKMG